MENEECKEELAEMEKKVKEFEERNKNASQQLQAVQDRVDQAHQMVAELDTVWATMNFEWGAHKRTGLAMVKVSEEVIATKVIILSSFEPMNT